MFEVTCVGFVYNTANSGIRSIAKCQYIRYIYICNDYMSRDRAKCVSVTDFAS